MEKLILVDLNSGTAQMTEKQYQEHLCAQEKGFNRTQTLELFMDKVVSKTREV